MSEHEHEHDEQAGEALAPDEIEAQAAEGEGGEPEPEPEPDDEPEALGPTPEQLKAVDKLITRHERDMRKVMGEAARYFGLCPACDGVGLLPTQPPAAAGLKQDPFTERCERCDGHGAVATGAREDALHSIPCPGCAGSGYTQRHEQPNIGAIGNGPPAAATAPPTIAPAVPIDPADVARLKAAGYVVVEPPTGAAPVST